MKRILAVYDVDPFYAQRFAEVANQRENIPFTVMAFTSMERLKNYVKEHQVELLLINSQVGQEEIRQLGISRVVSLTEGEGTDADYEYPSVYKYQSSAGIIREVIACYSERTKEIYSAESGTPARIIGVYSPVGRCLKTSFALTMGQLMASDRRVLYITLEDYSGMAAMTGEEYKNDLSDVLYYFGQGNFNLLRLSGIVHSIGNMDYIPPVRYPEDLSQVSSSDMADMIQRLAAESGYEIMIIDVGNYGHQAAPLLSVCQVIYMPVKEDGISAAKIQEFEDYLGRVGKREVMDKVRKLKLPYHRNFGKKENYIEQLLWSELGDYVRRLLRGGNRQEMDF